MNARLVANIPIGSYDERLIPILGVFVTFDAIDHVEDCRLFLKKNWRDFVIQPEKKVEEKHKAKEGGFYKNGQLSKITG